VIAARLTAERAGQFAVIALVLAVLITASVVAAAVCEASPCRLRSRDRWLMSRATRLQASGRGDGTP
jgi:hypothetical protein